jgi:RNA-directed DNA polymerase
LVPWRLSKDLGRIPEGKTDTIYLKAAIEKLTAFRPKLGVMKDGKLTTAIRFMNLTSTVHDVLQLGGGTGDFKFFKLSDSQHARK